MSCRWFLSLSMLAFVSCASRPPAYQEQGWASYVADQYTGRLTSSGEIYYPQAYTAAHASLPFGTVVTVKNAMNGRTVNVTVNDRFPHYPGRVINLSSAAAQQIGIPYMQKGQVQLTAKKIDQPSYGRPQQPPAYGRGGYQPQPAYSPQPAYPSQPAYPPTSPPAYAPQPAYGGYAPKPSVPGYAPPAPTYQVQPPAGGVPSYSGRSATPPGLRTF